MRRALVAVLLACLGSVALVQVVPLPSAGAVETHGPGYRSWRRGSPLDVHVHTTGGLMLEGGASDRWPAWEWFLKQAGYGDIVILCATCDNVYNQYVVNFHEVDSVQTLKLTKRRAASDPFVLNSVAAADGIFFAGGDQSDYVRVWKDTPLEDTINAVVARGAAVGGISAGLAILGQFLFAAEKDTIQSGQALRDCYAKKVTLERDLLEVPGLTATITDTHFTQRDRMGRLLTFMARTIQDGWSNRTTGIGVDEATAALVHRDGTVDVVGQGSVSFLRMRSSDVTTCRPGTPLRTPFIAVSVVPRGSSFDLVRWRADPAVHVQYARAKEGRILWAP